MASHYEPGGGDHVRFPMAVLVDWSPPALPAESAQRNLQDLPMLPLLLCPRQIAKDLRLDYLGCVF